MFKSLISKGNQQLSLQYNAFNFSPVYFQTQWQIKKDFLLPQPPKQPASAFAAYVKHQYQNNSTIKQLKNTQAIKEISLLYQTPQHDKDLKQQLKQKYEQERILYQKEKEQYLQKYDIPPKQVTAYNLYIKENYPKLKDMKKISEQFKKLTTQQLQEYQKKADQISSKNLEIRQKFESLYKIPFVEEKSAVKLFREQNKHLTKEQQQEQYKALTAQQRTELIQNDLKQQQEKMLNFLKTLNVEPAQFKKAYNQHVRALKKAEKKMEEKEVEKKDEKLQEQKTQQKTDNTSQKVAAKQ